jgi:hypothetical protein
MTPRGFSRTVSLLAFWLGCLGGCNNKERTAPKEKIEPSPNASILPAPLAPGSELLPRPLQNEGRVGIPADSAGRLILQDAGPPPARSLREDEVLPRDTLSSKDMVGATLDAAFRWFDVPGPPPGAPVVNEALKRAREKTDLKLSIDLLAAGRMRILLSSVAFALPLNSELRARADRYGHVLVWPDGAAYRLVTPGALRAMLAERRADVTALVAAKSRDLVRGNLLGLPTTRTELVTRTGTVVIEQTEFGGLGGSGTLLCRALVELVAAEPMTRACELGRLPLRAEYRWPNGGRLEFEVKAITRRQDLAVGSLFVPPAWGVFKIGELPPQADGVLLTRDDLAGLRSRSVAPTKDGPPGTPGEGFTAVNTADSMAYVLIDGVPVSWVRPHSEQYIIGPKPGVYTVSWRDFLGVDVGPPKPVELPARVVLGAENDAGKR